MRQLSFVIMALLLSFTVFAADAKARKAWVCGAQAAPKVNVIWSTDKISYNLTRTSAQLSNMPIDTKSPYAKHVVTKVGGLMRGGLEASSAYKIQKLRNEYTRQNCMWISEINVRITIHPTIFIAKEYPKGTCMFNSVLEHEMKHIQVDRDVAQKYRDRLRNAAVQAARKIGVVGPKNDYEVRRIERKIQEYFNTAMNVELKQMHAERGSRQQAVDNIHEYERVQNQCKGSRHTHNHSRTHTSGQRGR